jgi:GNAT superfamily N-acetyltransferase
MAIRFAQIDDVPALVALGERMHGLTRFRSLDYRPQKVARALADVISKGQNKYVLLVATGGEGGHIVGGLLGVLEQHIFSDQLTASVIHFDVLPEARMGGHGVRLLKAFEAWCVNRKVVEIVFGINSGEHLETLAKFACRMGYLAIGQNFVKTAGSAPTN